MFDPRLGWDGGVEEDDVRGRRIEHDGDGREDVGAVLDVDGVCVFPHPIGDTEHKVVGGQLVPREGLAPAWVSENWEERFDPGLDDVGAMLDFFLFCFAEVGPPAAKKKKVRSV